MDKQEFEKKLTGWDENNREIRVERWSNLIPEDFTANLPHLIWRYITEAEDMYIYGFFIGVIMLCAGTVELTLSDQVASRLKLGEREAGRFELQQFITLGHRLDLISDSEAYDLDQFRFLRNNLIHGNSGKLEDMSRRLYQVNGFYEKPTVETYLSPTTGNGINHDALRFLGLTRNIIMRFYGQKPTDSPADGVVTEYVET
jgi:hypothetical protein